MKAVSARDANQGFSVLLSAVEHGEEVIITKRGRPVAILSPYTTSDTTPERGEARLAQAVALMDMGLPWGDRTPPLTRDEMHER